MATLRVDPWDPEYGGSLEFDPLDELPQAVELDVEDVPWQPVKQQPVDELPCCAFLDGVRRIDLRLFAEDETEAVAPALAGSWAVGTAWVDPSPVDRRDRRWPQPRCWGRDRGIPISCRGSVAMSCATSTWASVEARRSIRSSVSRTLCARPRQLLRGAPFTRDARICSSSTAR